MKNLFSFTLILCFTFFVSCSNESFEELVPDTTGTDGENPNPDPDPDPDTPDNTVTTPCDFDLSGVTAGETIVIDCVLDLQGETINLPTNVSFKFEGGDIIGDGKLIFSGGTIAGELLSSKLTIEGNVQLEKPTFKFFASRWDVVEGRTTSEIAQENNNKLEDLMFWTKELGATTFEIDKLDAYFEVSKVTSTTTNQNFYPSVEAINVPSNFTLRMTNNTVLRVQPNSRKNYALLALRDVTSARVEGGILIGDRAEHDDNSQPGPHAFGYIVMIHGSNNIDVVGVTMKDGTGDGVKISSLGFTFEAGYIPSNNIRVTNCTMDNNRRNNMSITDGFNITVEGNTFLNAGVDNPGSEGKAPGFALDIEAYRGLVNGVLTFYEDAYDITIRNNVEKNSKYGSFIVAIGHDVDIIGNETEKAISIGAGYNVNISDNQLTANPDNLSSAGIVTGHPDSRDTYNNVISNNTIRGYNLGIAAYQRDTEIFGNTIENFGIGIQPKDIRNFKIYNNTFSSDRDGSVGIFGNLTTMDNIRIYENTIQKVSRESVKFVAVNEGTDAADYRVTIDNNMLNHSGTFSRSNGLDFTNNTMKEGIQFINAKNMNITGNTIESTGDDGIIIGDGCSNLNIQSNNITVIGSNLQCIDEKSTGTNITIAGNTCVD